MVKLTSSSPGLTGKDSVRLLWVSVLRSLEGNDEAAARKGLSQILDLDRSAQPPPSAPARLRELLAEGRARLPARTLRKQDAVRLAAEREPEVTALLRAVQSLYDNLEVDAAAIVLDLAPSPNLLSGAERARLYVWRAVLNMELGKEDETEARGMFRDALELDASVRCPEKVPPKTLRVWQEVKASTVPPPQAPLAGRPELTGGPPMPAPGAGMRTWGLGVGGSGAALVAGGVVAGLVALGEHEKTKQSSEGDDMEGYLRHRAVSRTAATTANVLYAAGAVALGAGTLLYLKAPGGLSVGAGASSGKATLTVEGSF